MTLKNEFYKKNKKESLSECSLAIENFNLYYMKKENIVGFIDLKITSVKFIEYDSKKNKLQGF